MTTSNIDLQKLAQIMKINLICVCSKDELKNYPRQIGLYIINMENSDKDGSHWICFVIYQADGKLKALYMDTYGLLPPMEIEDYLHLLKSRFAYSTKQIQKIYTTDCGFYCLSLAFVLQYKRTCSNVLDEFARWQNMFSDNNLSMNLEVLKKSFEPYNVDFYNKTATLK